LTSWSMWCCSMYFCTFGLLDIFCCEKRMKKKKRRKKGKKEGKMREVRRKGKG